MQSSWFENLTAYFAIDTKVAKRWVDWQEMDEFMGGRLMFAVRIELMRTTIGPNEYDQAQ